MGGGIKESKGGIRRAIALKTFISVKSHEKMSSTGGNFDGAGVAATDSEMESGGLQNELGTEEIDGLLHANMLETLADFDFSYPDLNDGDSADSSQSQQQKPHQLSTSPRVSGRKRSFTEACNWDNLGPKAVSEISASLLAGSPWDFGTDSMGSNGNSNHLQPATPLACARAVVAPSPPRSTNDSSNSSIPSVGAQHQGHAGNNGKGTIGTGCNKGRRGSGAGSGAATGGGVGTGKKPLNPDRMERKASREKRRREEVNQQFDRLLQVLEEAEATSGLEPPAVKEGKTTAPACVNGRRVEVLSRTIAILKKLLEERRVLLAAEAASAVATGSKDDDDAPGRQGSSGSTEEETPVVMAESMVVAAAAAPTSAASNFMSPPPDNTSHIAGDPIEVKDADVPKVQDAPTLTAASAVQGAGADTNTAGMVHRMAVPLSGHQASMMMPSGFTGMSGQSFPAPNSMMPGHHGQPIFIAVPMYMPQGQGVPVQSVENATQAPLAAPSLPTALGAATTDSVQEAAAASGVAQKVEPATPPSGKETWAMPPGMSFPSLTLPTPQFVTQALSTEEADEKPTHAMCA